MFIFEICRNSSKVQRKIFQKQEWNSYFARAIASGNYTEDDIMDEIEVALEMKEAFSLDLEKPGEE